jgi:hypothetical protein
MQTSLSVGKLYLIEGSVSPARIRIAANKEREGDS